MATVKQFLASLDPDTRAMANTLRAIIVAAGPDLNERIKWNAPSFALGDEDRITLGIEPAGGVRVVLHRGATVQDTSEFTFDDIDGLANWPAPDRGVIVFRDVDAIIAKTPALFRLFQRWIDKTR